MKRLGRVLLAVSVVLVLAVGAYVLRHLLPSEAGAHLVFTPSEELLYQQWDGGEMLAKDLFSQYLGLGKKGKLLTSIGPVNSLGFRFSYHDKITDYKINEISNARLEENRLKFWVSYDVKPKRENSDWVAGNGVAGEDGWIVRKSAFVEFESLENGAYKFISSNTGP